jgi:chaperonin GroES
VSNKNVITGAIPAHRSPIPAPRRTRIKDITPLYDRILVRQLDENEQSRGGLVIPLVARENKEWMRGEVAKVGGGRVSLEGKVAPLSVSVGDIVLFPRKAALPIPLGDEDDAPCWLLVREPDILGVITVEEVPVIEVVSHVDSSEVGL